ncbi:hypothetical protein [Microcystis sp. LE19-59.1C]|uniref:hypothetical protein n=1 Tax=Microcystis sp. LE19-59.1C TaxID=3016442 RepID=UPI0022BEB84A|nr:hypothetical protein [Microcystis sp. LE19-59.1C]MCZ8291056.1 hypothetical protein [Microcystis sp. LE19-59.1C]
MGAKIFCGGAGGGGGGGGVGGFTSFEVANYLIFREKVPKFPPDHPTPCPHRKTFCRKPYLRRILTAYP